MHTLLFHQCEFNGKNTSKSVCISIPLLTLQNFTAFGIATALHNSKHLPVSIVLVYRSVDIFLIIGQL